MNPPKAGAVSWPIPAVVEARNLEKRLKSGHVLKPLTFTLRPGDFLGIVGPPGVGKSTLLRALATLAPFDGGELLVNGVRSHQVMHVRRQLGYCTGEPEYFPELSLREFLTFFAESCGVDPAYIPVRVQEVLRRTQLQVVAEDPMGALPRSALRRAGLARALVHDPVTVLVDDPLRRLQGNERDLWVDVLTAVRNEGRCIVMAAETVREVRHLLTHACVLAAGRILGCGPIATLDSRVSQLRSIQLQVVGASRALGVLEARVGVFQATVAGDIIKVLFMGDSAEVLELVRELSSQGLPVVSFRQEPAYLM